MTNLEWIRTLSEEEFADWLYDEWLHHLQYRWSSSRGGLIIWLKDRKTENSSEKPNNCEHITEDGVTCAKYPACDDCLDNPLNKVKGSERLLKGKDEPTGYNLSPVDKDINVRSKDEPQKRCDECIHFDKPYKKRDKDGMLIIGVECDGMDEPCDKWTDEPQTDCQWK